MEAFEFLVNTSSFKTCVSIFNIIILPLLAKCMHHLEKTHSKFCVLFVYKFDFNHFQNESQAFTLFLSTHD